MKELFKDNIIPERTMSEILLGTDSFYDVSGTGENLYNPTITGGILQGTSFRSADSGARLEIFPEADPTIGMVMYDSAGNEVIKTLVDGDDEGDIYLGDYSGDNGLFYDKSTSTFYIKGSITVMGGDAFSKTNNDLDDISDGTSYGKVAITDISSGHITVVASTASININDTTFGNQGIQFQYNSGTPRAYIGDGSNAFWQFDGAKLTWKAANTELDADGKLTLAGSTITTPTITGIQSGSEIAIQGWQQDMTFSASDADTVAWTSGTITLMNGDTYSINAGNTGDITALTYIYLDINTSETALQTTTTASDAVGSGKILIAVAENNSDTDSDAVFQVFGGSGGNNLLVDNIVANSASTNEFISNTAQIKDAIITNAKINDLSVAKLTAGSIFSKAITLAVTPDAGDSYIAAGKTDFNNTISGFILGIDDSDSDKAKLYIGDSTYYLNWTGSGIVIKAEHSNLALYDCVVDAAGYGDYTTLDAAVTAGETSIYIRAGSYTATGNITPAANTVIVGEGMEVVTIALAGYQLLLSNDDCRVSEITFTGTKARDFQISASGDDVQISRVRLDVASSSNWHSGITAAGDRFILVDSEVLVNKAPLYISGADANINRCKFYGGRQDTDNTPNGCANEITLAGANTIFSHNWFLRTNSGNFGSGGIYITGNSCIISNNKIEEDSGYATAIWTSGTDTKVVNNHISGWSNGINLYSEYRQVCNGNTIYNVAHTGIYVAGAISAGYGYKTVIGNVIYSPGGNGISGLASRCVISGNAVYGAGGHGISGWTGNSSYVIITSNYCGECTDSGIYIMGGGDYVGQYMVINSNECCGNDYGIYAKLSSSTVVGNVCYINTTDNFDVTDSYGCQIANNVGA
jgi:hypothetical protein